MVIQMVELETVEDLAENIADMAGVYGTLDYIGDHEDSCMCRVCFVIRMTERIRQAVANEKLLYGVPAHEDDAEESALIVGTMFYNY